MKEATIPTEEAVNKMAEGSRRHGRPVLGVLVALVTMFAIVFQAGVAQAAVRTEIPEEQAGPPYYARILTGVAGTEEVSAVVFYRDPACVPADFNLIQFFDIPRAFACPLTVEGFALWKNGPPPQDQAPFAQELFGAGPVPVWFVATSELEAATADGVLTIAELAALPSLVVGSASSFHETLHPTQGATTPMIELTAKGSLADGGTFQLHGVCAVRTDCSNAHVRIRFR